MGKAIDIAGNMYGRLTVIELSGHNKHNQRLWRCVCDCGNSAEVLGSLLRKGDTRSCGCLARESAASINKSHGKANTAIYRIWRSMMDRCHLPTSHAYSRYGARGVAVCERWHDFENFYTDMGDKPKGMSLERTDNDGPYSQENVQWASAKDQANNRRSSRWVEFNGERRTLAQWADHFGIHLGTLWARLKRGIPMDEAVLPGDRRFTNVSN